MHPLTQITCGTEKTSGAISEVQSYLCNSLDRLLVNGKALKKSADDTQLALYGPYIARATIEVAFTAIMARFDPFRVLAIRKSQLSPSYDVKTRNLLAFNWTSDVKGEGNAKDWTAHPRMTDIQRGILSGHYNDLIWEEAFTMMLDAVPVSRGGAWMHRLKSIQPESFIARFREDADRAYSELSKAVHQEFVIPMTSQYDRVTMTELMERAWELVGALSLTACYSPVLFPLTDDPLDIYEEAQSELNS